MKELRLEINCEQDIVAVRLAVRKAARSVGLSLADETKSAIAASELAQNIFLYSGRGFMECREVTGSDLRIGIEMVFEDNGPGIADVDQAMMPGFSSNGRLGMGLIGSKRLMDEFYIESCIGAGTIIRILKFKTD